MASGRRRRSSFETILADLQVKWQPPWHFKNKVRKKFGCRRQGRWEGRRRKTCKITSGDWFSNKNFLLNDKTLSRKRMKVIIFELQNFFFIVKLIKKFSCPLKEKFSFSMGETNWNKFGTETDLNKLNPTLSSFSHLMQWNHNLKNPIDHWNLCLKHYRWALTRA